MNKSETRRRGLMLIVLTIVLAGLGWTGWHWFMGRHHLDTDNAYVVGNVLQITPLVSGTVLSVQVEETDVVKAGQLLVKLDPADAHVNLDQSKAQLAQSVREVRALFASSASLSAQVNSREADLQRVQMDLARVQSDVNRRAPLVASGAVSQEEFQHVKSQLSAAQSTVNAAQSALLSAKEQLTAGLTQTEGTSIQDHPSVQRAAAKVREAYLAFQRVELKAPTDGQIAKRSVQVGQRVQAGAPLMTLVALNQLWSTRRTGG
jgi:membrane fusion protein (multidrug efflux system)